MMTLTKRSRILLAAAVLFIFALALVGLNTSGNKKVQQAQAAPPVLSVALVPVQAAMLPVHVPASGHVVAWQEAIVGAEADGLRLTEVRINVGDVVKRGQVLALFNADIVEAELAEARASVAQAEAGALEAEANYRRAKALGGSGALSAQQLEQTMVAAMSARARLDAMRAFETKQRLRLAQTRVLAPSDGIISALTATVGAVVPAGQELFRLIEEGRLEWRALVAMSDINKLTPGQSAQVFVQGQGAIQGRLRMVAPTIDTHTHNGLVYVDLPVADASNAAGEIRAGSFARGYLDVSEGLTLTLPQRALVLRDGFHYVMQVEPVFDVTLQDVAVKKVVMKKVTVGRHLGDSIEITAGLVASELVIASGLGFLSEGDLVRVVNELAHVPGRELERDIEYKSMAEGQGLL